jgi:hypothetical protein
MPLDPRERETLVEAATTAWRPRDPDGRARPHPAWCDLDDAGREALHEATVATRALEAALDPDGLSSTARAVLARLP